jgi:hypothetical protein
VALFDHSYVCEYLPWPIKERDVLLAMDFKVICIDRKLPELTDREIGR